MKRRKCMFVVVALSLLARNAAGQEKTKAAEAPRGTAAEVKTTDSPKEIVPLKVTIVISEYDGEKKLSSLPYTLSLRAADEQSHYFGSLRMGVRIPISTGGKESNVQYQDVGSNIDCEARSLGAGRYLLDLRVERSSIFPTREEHSSDQKTDEPQLAGQPLIRAFRASTAVMLRDGQPTQGTVATDPLNGHVLKVDLTLNVLK
jgi:hypothetical protein